MFTTTTTPLTRQVTLWLATAVGTAAIVVGGWSTTRALASAHPPVRAVAAASAGAPAGAAQTPPGATGAGSSPTSAGTPGAASVPATAQPSHESDSGSGD